MGRALEGKRAGVAVAVEDKVETRNGARLKMRARRSRSMVVRLEGVEVQARIAMKMDLGI